jgi:TP901 family phage tail tape measure protein
MSNAINVFKLEAKDASKVTDILTNAANASSIEIKDVALSFQMAASVFSSFQGPVVGSDNAMRDLATAVSLMGKAGIAGSDAGTSLKTMMMHLASPTDKAAKMMADMAKQIGITGTLAYDSSGRMRPLFEIVGNVKRGTEGMTQAQRDYTLSTIFGTDAMRAAVVLMDNVGPKQEAMSRAMDRAGSAAEVAGAKSKGLSGAISDAFKLFKTFAIEIYEKFEPSLEKIVRWMNERLPEAFAKAKDAVKELWERLEPVVTWMKENEETVKAFFIALGAAAVVLALAAAISALLSPLVLVSVGIAAVAAYLTHAYNNSATFKRMVDTLVVVFKNIASVIRDVVVRAFDVFVGVLVQAVSLWVRYGDDVKAALDMIMAVIRPHFEMIKSIITAVMRAIKGDWSGAWEALKQAASKGVEMIVAAAKLLGGLLKGAMKLAWELAQKAFDAGKDLVVEAAKKLPDLILKALGKLGDLLLEAGKDIVRGLAKGISGAVDLVKDAASSLAKKLPGWVKKVLGISSPSKVFAEIGVDIVRGLAVGIDEEQNTALRAVNDLADKIVSAFTASIDAVRGAYGAFKSTRGATEQAAAAQEALNELRVKASTIDQRLVDAERRLADAKAKGEDGASDLRDAEADLAELRREKLSLPKEMADATRQLADAQDSLTDATLAQFEAARKLADQGPKAVEVFAAYASQAGVAAAEIDKITSAARSLAASIDGIPSMKTVAVTLVQNTQTPQYDPGSAIATNDAGINSGRRVENGVEYVWVEGIGWVRKSGGQVQTGARASGGPVMAGGAYVVGENGPELFRPSRSGTIVPGGGATIVVNVAGSVLSERDLTAAVVDGLRRSGAVRPDGSVRVAR